MASVDVDDRAVVIVFSWWEVPFVGFRRLEIELSHIADVTLAARPMRVNLGPRAGFWITGIAKIGRFGTVRRSLTSVRRGQAALHLTLLDGEYPFHEVLVGDDAAAEHARFLGVVR